MTSYSHILYCQCSRTDLATAPSRQQTRQTLASLPPDRVSSVEDLCKLAVQKPDHLKKYSQYDSLLIIACQPRAVKALFHYAGVPLDLSKTRLANLREESVENIFDAIPADKKDPAKSCCCASAKNLQPKPHASNEEHAWYPLIDFDRCINCLQCMNFCLFDVYTTDPQGKIQVTNPENCKINCPACARICPTQAIIFPKHPFAPINGGEKKTGQPEDPNDLPLDPAALKNMDLYTLLRNRTQRASACGCDCHCDNTPEPIPSELQKAFLQRQLCLQKNKQPRQKAEDSD